MMKNIGPVLSLLAPFALFAGGCSADNPPAVENDRELWDAPITELECGSVKDPTIVVVGSSLSLDGTSLILKGTAEFPANLAIRELRVGAVAATRDSFNFRTWTATIPESSWTSFEHGETTFKVPVNVDNPCYTSILSVEAKIPDGALPEPEPEPEPSGDGGKPAAE